MILNFSKKYSHNKVKLSTLWGSSCYSSPEMLRKLKYYPQPIDIWGLGIILYVMISNELPFNANSEDILHRKIIQSDCVFPHTCNNSVKNLIKRIFVTDPSNRITLEEIKLDPVYYTGKANFYKYCKIYSDNGHTLPIVKEYIKQQVIINYLKQNCVIEFNANTVEKTNNI